MPGQRFRKRPVEITAARWWANGDHPDDYVGEEVTHPVSGEKYTRVEGGVVRYYRHPKVSGDRACQHCERLMHDHGWIDTLEGGYTVCPGDWIITGVQGAYPCKPEIFAQTYEPVEANTDG